MSKTVPVERTADNTFGEGGVRECHPAFGMIGIFRTSGQRHLFGSPLERHNGYVTLRVRHAERFSSGHGSDSFFGRSQIINVVLSEAQFAQLITNWNQGEGVPCTLDWTEKGGQLPDWPDEDHVADTARVRDEFIARIADVRRHVEEAAVEVDGLLAKKGALTQEEKLKVRAAILSMERLVGDTGPFMAEQFVEATEKTVQKAKTEIDAFATRVIHQTGLDALRELRVAGLGTPVPVAELVEAPRATRADMRAEHEAECSMVEREGCSECSVFPCAEQACPYIPGAGGVEFEPEEEE